MSRTHKTIDAGATRAKLNDLVGAVRREAEGAESDPFDDAMLAAVVGIAEALKAKADAVAAVEAQLGKVRRMALR